MYTTTMQLRRRTALVVLGSLFMTWPVSAQTADRSASQQWMFSIGAGAVLLPDYEGSDDFGISPIPLVNVTWNDRVYLRFPDELGVTIYRNHGLSVSAGLGVDLGRSEDDSDDLAGLEQIDPAATARGRISYTFGPVTTAVRVLRYLGGSDGLELGAQIGAAAPLPFLAPRNDRAPAPRISFDASLEWSDRNAMTAYFGVAATESARSGLPQYSAEAGLKSVGSDLSLLYFITPRLLVNAFVEYDRLIGDAGDSPIVRDPDQWQVGIVTVFTF